jgi:hypothetical protein
MTQGVLKTHGICLMMYFKNNWNAGPFFLLHQTNAMSFQDTLCHKNSQTFQFLIEPEPSSTLNKFLQTFRPVYTPTCC